MLPKELFWAILLALVFYAFRRGALDERAAALTCLVGSVATVALGALSLHRYNDVEGAVLIVDASAFFIFTVIALKSARFWPLWVAGFQLSSMLAHFLQASGADMIPRVYAAAERFWIYPIFLAIAIGVWRVKKYEQPHHPNLMG